MIDRPRDDAREPEADDRAEPERAERDDQNRFRRGGRHLGGGSADRVDGVEAGLRRIRNSCRTACKSVPSRTTPFSVGSAAPSAARAAFRAGSSVVAITRPLTMTAVCARDRADSSRA